MKGVELSTNAVILIILGILVLVVMVYHLLTGTLPLVPTKYDTEFSNACRIHINTETPVSQIVTEDVNGDGQADNLLTVCRLLYAMPNLNETACSQMCKERFGVSWKN